MRALSFQELKRKWKRHSPFEQRVHLTIDVKDFRFISSCYRQIVKRVVSKVYRNRSIYYIYMYKICSKMLFLLTMLFSCNADYRKISGNTREKFGVNLVESFYKI